MADYKLSTQAYSKLFLHTAKYPHCSVNGVLLTHKSNDEERNTITFIDAIPLFHLSLNLTAMLEVALVQIDDYCKSRGLVIGGYYQANDNIKDNTPSPATYRMADKIHEQFNNTALLMVDNGRISADCREEIYRVYTHVEHKWKLQDEKATVLESTLGDAAELLANRAHRKLYDFDNHLDDMTLDWLNPEINDMLEDCT